MTHQPLNGIRVLDLSRLLPGPFVTQLFVDLGAEVIKVEKPGSGDYAREFTAEQGLAGMFDSVNRGKKSIGLDYRSDRGRTIFFDLCKTSDVVIESFRPGAVNSWGIAYDDVRAIKPDIIYCSLSGYGQNGPYRDRAGHDINYTAIGGALMMNAAPNGFPMPYGVPLSDLSGSMLAAVAILAALTGRAQTGEGQYIDISLLDGMVSLVAPLIGGAYFHSQKTGEHSALVSKGRAYYSVYKTRDGEFMSFAPIEPHFWDRFCRATVRIDLLSRQFDPQVERDLTDLFLSKTRAEWIDLLSNVDACVEPINTFEEMLIDPQVQARGHIEMENGKAVGMTSPFIFARTDRSPAPRLGQHTREVLSTIGVSENDQSVLFRQGIIQ